MVDDRCGHVGQQIFLPIVAVTTRGSGGELSAALHLAMDAIYLEWSLVRQDCRPVQSSAAA
jgi:hypothetical protein